MGKGAFAAFVTLALVQSSLQVSPSTGNATAACNTYVVNGVPGGFTQRVFADFSGANSGGDISVLLRAYGLTVSNDPDHPILSTPFPHIFVGTNVALGDGALNLKVSAYSGTGPIRSAELATSDRFKYASVRTVLKSSKTRGVVEGSFLYLNDNQETDWEILTSTTLMPSDCTQAGIWATNQALNNQTVRTTQRVPFTFDPSEAFHEYRIDWSAAATAFYIDGQQKARLTTNVPTQAGPWVWNAWSSGDCCWSNGPPAADSVTQIRSMEIYKGWTPTVSGNICNA